MVTIFLRFLPRDELSKVEAAKIIDEDLISCLASYNTVIAFRFNASRPKSLSYKTERIR